MAAKLTMLEEEWTRQPPLGTPVRRDGIFNRLRRLIDARLPNKDLVGHSVVSYLDGGSSISGLTGTRAGVGREAYFAFYNLQCSTPKWNEPTVSASAILVFQRTSLVDNYAFNLGGVLQEHIPYGGLIYLSSFWSSRWCSGISVPSWLTLTDVVCLVISVKDGEQVAYANGRLLHRNTLSGGFSLPSNLLFYSTDSRAIQLLSGAFDTYLPAKVAAELSANPWQIFEPEEIPLFKPTVTAQYARPISDVSAGGWTASTGSDLYAMLDETAADDGDYITSTTASTCEVALGSLSDPALSTGHIVRYRISATGGGIVVRLRQGTTTIATWTHDPAPGSLTTYAQTLSSGEADAITDYSALRLQFEATA